MINVLNKVDDTLNVLDKSKIVMRLKELKKIMNDDEEIQKLIETFNQEKVKYQNDNIVTKELTEAKEKLYKNEVVSEYRKLYSELNMMLARFSKSLTILLKNEKGSCNNN